MPVTSPDSSSDRSLLPRRRPVPRIPRPDPNLVAPTVYLAGNPPDYEMIADTWEAVRVAVGRAQAMETLQEEHQTLQRAYQAEHHRAAVLQERVDGIVEFATVRAPQIQAKVDRLLRQRDLDRAVIAEFQEELAKRADYHLGAESDTCGACTKSPYGTTKTRSRRCRTSWTPS